MVGQKDHRLAGVGLLEADAAQVCRLKRVVLVAIEGDGLVEEDPGRKIYRCRVQSPRVEVGLARVIKNARAWCRIERRSKSR